MTNRKTTSLTPYHCKLVHECSKMAGITESRFIADAVKNKIETLKKSASL